MKILTLIRIKKYKNVVTKHFMPLVNAKSVIQNILLMPLYLYRYFISPILPRSCRYHPSCSSYTIDAVKYYGIKGIFLGFKRIMKCHPWGGSGFDPVPQDIKQLDRFNNERN